MLRNLGKGFGLEQVRRTLTMLQAEDLPYSCFLLLGGPGETQATVQESVSLLEEYEPRMVNLTVGIRIHPGLPLHKIGPWRKGWCGREKACCGPNFTWRRR